MIHTDARKRHDFVLLFDVTNGNPNGDPDAGNLPRVVPDTMHGLVTDVAIKRKIRDYVALTGSGSIFIQSQTALNSLIFKAFRDTGLQPPQIPIDDDETIEWLNENSPEGFSLEDGTLAYGGESTSVRDIRKVLFDALGDAEENKELREKLADVAKRLGAAGGKKITPVERDKARARLCQDYYDIRMFGAVLSTGLNAGQVRGPMQLAFARSIDPISPLNNTLTRKARTTLARMETGTTEMGRKAIVPYGLYRAHGFFNPFLAEQTGVTDADLGIFWRAACDMFQFDHSAARPEMAVRGLYVFTHDDKLGNAHFHRLFEQIRVSRIEGIDPPEGFEHYMVQAPADGPVPNFAGVTLTSLVY